MSSVLEIKDLHVSVETEQQFRLLAESVHPDYIQGFLFGAPLSKRGIAAMIQAIRPLKEKQRNTSTTQG